MLVFVLGLVFVMADGLEVAQGHAGQGLHRQPACRALRARGEEAFQVRADPVQQIHLAHPPHVGGAQRVLVRRGARRQQHLGFADAVLHRGGDQLQRLDAGQQAHFGLGRDGQAGKDEENEQTRHGKRLRLESVIE